MTYSVPDPASETSDPLPPDPAGPTPSAVVGPDGSGVEQAATDDPPLPSGLGAAEDGFDPVDTGNGADAPLPRHAAPEGFDAPPADAPPAPPQAQVAEVNDVPAAPVVVAGDEPGPDDEGSTAGNDDLEAAAAAPLRVGHDDADEYEKLVTDPEAAAEATKARMDAQAEAEKAAAGITPAEES